MFVPAALFLAAWDEAEFAGVLAHAMAHVAVASIPLIFMGGWDGSCKDNAAIPLGYLSPQRAFELEADAMALETTARAGFDPNALVRYIERVQRPPRDERIPAMNSTIARLGVASEPALSSSEFVAAQEAVRRLAPPARRKTPE